MPVGHCGTCGKLVAIVPGPQEWGSRQVEWRPVDHQPRATHDGCGGHVTVHDRGSFTVGRAECDRCGEIPLAEVAVSRDACRGSGRPLRGAGYQHPIPRGADLPRG